METLVAVICTNPAGESKTASKYPPGTWPLDTPGGRFYAEWDDQAPATFTTAISSPIYAS